MKCEKCGADPETRHCAECGADFPAFTCWISTECDDCKMDRAMQFYADNTTAANTWINPPDNPDPF